MIQNCLAYGKVCEKHSKICSKVNDSLNAITLGAIMLHESSRYNSYKISNGMDIACLIFILAIKNVMSRTHMCVSLT